MNSSPSVRWDEIRQRIAKNHPWYSQKGDQGYSIADFNLDALVFAALDPVSRESSLTYCPYLFESFLSDVSQALDNCLAYRRELYDLCTQATQRGLEYELFLNTLGPDRDLALLGTISEQARQEAAAYRASTTAFEGPNGEPPTDAVAAGLQAISKGFTSVRDRVSNVESQKEQYISQRYKATAQYQQDLEDLHSTDGSSLNYTQRVNRIAPLILDEIVDAYRKSRSIVAGLNRVLDHHAWNPISIIALSKTGFLDEFVRWFRKLVRQYQIYTQKEIGWTRFVSFRMGAALADWQNTYIHTVTSTKGFTFKIQPENTRYPRWSRVIGVAMGLAKYPDSPGAATYNNVTLPFQLWTPSFSFQDGAWPNDRVGELFQNVTLATRDLFNSKGTPLGASPIRNVLAGYLDDWTLQLSPDLDSGPVSGLCAPTAGRGYPNWTAPEMIPDDIYVQLKLKTLPSED